MVEVSNLMENAKDNMINMLKNKNLVLTIFLFLVIGLIVFALALHLNTTLSKKNTNNASMIKGYEDLGGTEIGSINSGNAEHKHLLRDYYVMSSYNTCCGGNFTKDFVDIIPLKETIRQGARLLDFEIYSLDGEPVIAAGKEQMKYLLKEHIIVSLFTGYESSKNVSIFRFSCSKSNDPLFLSFK